MKKLLKIPMMLVRLVIQSALLALNQGIIEQPAYVALVLMSLFTTLLVPLLLRNWLYRSQ